MVSLGLRSLVASIELTKVSPLQRHTSRSSDKLSDLANYLSPTRIAQPEKQSGLHQVAGEAKRKLLSLLTDDSVLYRRGLRF